MSSADADCRKGWYDCIRESGEKGYVDVLDSRKGDSKRRGFAGLLVVDMIISLVCSEAMEAWTRAYSTRTFKIRRGPYEKRQAVCGET